MLVLTASCCVPLCSVPAPLSLQLSPRWWAGSTVEQPDAIRHRVQLGQGSESSKAFWPFLRVLNSAAFLAVGQARTPLFSLPRHLLGWGAGSAYVITVGVTRIAFRRWARDG